MVLSTTSRAQQISGSYIETRSADVYTGFCVANGEVNLTGDQAILGWKVEQGTWDGVNLNGLGVVAAVKANATLGDRYTNPFPAKAVLIVDARATKEQRQAGAAKATHRRSTTANRTPEDCTGSKHPSLDSSTI